MTNLTKTPEWLELSNHYNQIKNSSIFELFKKDKDRARKFRICSNGIYFDYSKNLITDEGLNLLINLAKASDIERWRLAMFEGEKINNTENRAVLHTALRRPDTDIVKVDGKNVMDFIHSVLKKMEEFSDKVRNGDWKGYTGKEIKNIINIGIGGSDLGPKMVCNALQSYSRRDLNMYFVSNIDGTDIAEVLRVIDPETSLFIVASKTFTTQETIRNAQSAREWLIEKIGDEKAIANHFVAISTNEKAVSEFGINPENMFKFKNWVGGRYSLWSAIGLPIAISVGFENFRNLLNGAYEMDQHFLNAPLNKNMAVILAVIAIWNRNFMKYSNYAIIPYDHYLRDFPSYMQQVDMESNGKYVNRDGNKIVDYDTAPVLFGGTGTNSQHSFFQLIHQGTDIVPCDFIIAKETLNPIANKEHHNKLQDNFLAQQQALMMGRNLKESGGDINKVFEGNRPSNGVIIDKLTPFNLGQLIALYEHKIFVQGIIWRINSFDQSGVELGKILAQNISESRKIFADNHDVDASTMEMLNYFKR